MSIDLILSFLAGAAVSGWICYRWGRSDEASDMATRNADVARADAKLVEGNGGPTPEK